VSKRKHSLYRSTGTRKRRRTGKEMARHTDTMCRKLDNLFGEISHQKKTGTGYFKPKKRKSIA